MNKANPLIQFELLDWENLQDGLQQKAFCSNDKRLRLLKITETFKEEHWCIKGHIGFVLSGKMKIDFDGIVRDFQKGDALWIEEGERSKHKVLMEKGGEVVLILFESIN